MSLIMQDVIGWVSSFILVLTIGRQVYTQWKAGTSEGVSIWLYIGEMVAEVGFVIYSWQVDNRVFVVTNAVMFLASLIGIWIVLKHRGAIAAS